MVELLGLAQKSHSLTARRDRSKRTGEWQHLEFNVSSRPRMIHLNACLSNVKLTCLIIRKSHCERSDCLCSSRIVSSMCRNVRAHPAWQKAKLPTSHESISAWSRQNEIWLWVVGKCLLLALNKHEYFCDFANSMYCFQSKRADLSMLDATPFTSSFAAT